LNCIYHSLLLLIYKIEYPYLTIINNGKKNVT